MIVGKSIVLVRVTQSGSQKYPIKFACYMWEGYTSTHWTRVRKTVLRQRRFLPPQIHFSCGMQSRRAAHRTP